MKDKKSRTERNRKASPSQWRIRRVKRRIAKKYYDRPEVRAEIVQAILEALLGTGSRRPP